jgi:hypothetical protein
MIAHKDTGMQDRSDGSAARRDKKRKFGKFMGSIIAGAFVGGVGTGVLLRQIDNGALGQVSGHHQAAMLVAMIYIVTGLFIAVGVIKPSFGAKFLNVEDADEINEHRKMHGYSCVGMLCFGGILALAALVEPVDIARGMALAACVALAAILVLVSWLQGGLADELMKAVSRQSAEMAFYLVLLVGGGWSVLAVLGFAPAPVPLDWLTMMSALLLLAAFGVCAARGMLTPR